MFLVLPWLSSMPQNFVDAFGNADGTGGANEAAEMATDAFGTEDLRFAFFIKSYRLMAAVGA